MKLLITGGAGYIGSHTSHQLIEAGHDVVILDNLYSGHRWAVPASARFVTGDIGDLVHLESLIADGNFDGVLHFAAYTDVAESVRDPAKYYRNNTLNSLGLFELCCRLRVPKLIFSSTAAVYGELDSDRVNESQSLCPINPYGHSKMMAERLLEDLARAPGQTLQFVILRYFNVAGARVDLKIGQATHNATHLIKVAAETAASVRDSMSIFGNDYATPDGTCLRDYIHVEDLATAHVNALDYLNGGGQSDVFNVGYGRPYSVLEVIETMRKVSGQSIEVSLENRRPGDAASVAADSEKLKNALGWAPKYDNLELICKTAFEWERKLRARS